MLSDCMAVAMVPVKDLQGTRSFYEDALGLKAVEEREDGIRYECGNGTFLLVFPSSGSASGTHTQMGFVCDDLDAEAEELRSRGVVFEEFDMPGVEFSNGIATMGETRGAWFRDPEGNLLSIVANPLVT